jgi:tetratricopeptide (TPR) repeat protein
VATSLNNLAVALFDSGDLAEARKCLTRAMEIDASIYGPTHPRLVVDLNNQSVILAAEGRAQEAQTAHEQALEMARGCYEPQHPVVRTASQGGILMLARLTEDAE